MLPIRLRGARTHNLQSVDLELRPGELVAITGPSGSGKSSLALDTLYAEGQRRFVESFSPYARQFLERLERPPVDSLDPIAATVAVDRKAPVKSSRSTLATLADLEPYLAALFACEAIPLCPDCHVLAVAVGADRAAEKVIEQWNGARAVVSYAARVGSAEEFLELRDSLTQEGYRRLVVGGTVRDIDEVRPSEALAAGVRVEVVVDRVAVEKRDARRLQQAIEIAWTRGFGRAELRTDGVPPKPARPAKTGKTGKTAKEPELDFTGGGEAARLHMPVARGLACPSCARSFEPARPGLFSYNSPLGACGDCRGFGRTIAVDWDKVIPDPNKSLAEGAIKAWNGQSATYERGVLKTFCAKEKIPFDVAWHKLGAAQQAKVLDGGGAKAWEEGKYPGIRAWFKWLESRTYKMHVRVFLARYREYVACTSCHGARLNDVARSYQVEGLDLAGWHKLTVRCAREKIRALTPRDPQGARVKEAIGARLDFLDEVGLGYLTLDRQARTLSGGEMQRASLTTALGAGLTGTLFVLDEPTVGLHALDVPPLAGAMRKLADGGNTVVVIEHDETIVKGAERIVELGPGAGKRGGRVLFDGSPRGDERAHRSADGPRLAPGHARRWSSAHAPRSHRESAHPRSPRQQPARGRRPHPARHRLRRHRSVRIRQVDAGRGDRLPRARSSAR